MFHWKTLKTRTYVGKCASSCAPKHPPAIYVCTRLPDVNAVICNRFLRHHITPSSSSSIDAVVVVVTETALRIYRGKWLHIACSVYIMLNTLMLIWLGIPDALCFKTPSNRWHEKKDFSHEKVIITNLLTKYYDTSQMRFRHDTCAINNMNDNCMCACVHISNVSASVFRTLCVRPHALLRRIEHVTAFIDNSRQWFVALRLCPCAAPCFAMCCHHTASWTLLHRHRTLCTRARVRTICTRSRAPALRWARSRMTGGNGKPDGAGAAGGGVCNGVPLMHIATVCERSHLFTWL